MLLHAVLFVIVIVIGGVSSQRPNNVCPAWRDYFNMQNNSRCWYDFAADAKVVRAFSPGELILALLLLDMIRYK